MAQSGQRLGQRAAFFLDRDGVIVEDVDLLTRPSELRILPGVVDALNAIAERGYATVLVTNQTVVARGLLSEGEVDAIHDALQARLSSEGAPPLTGVYFCPHHPHADIARYRVECDCRKPRPGMLERAARELGIDLSRSFMIGDRVSDIAAGKAASCRTVLVETGAHRAKPIVGMPPGEQPPKPDYTVGSLKEAVAAILGGDR